MPRLQLSDDQLRALDAIARGTDAYGSISPRALAVEGVNEESCGGLLRYNSWVDARSHELQRLGLVQEVYLTHGDREVSLDYDGYYSIMVRISRDILGGREAKQLLAEWRGRPRPHVLSRPSALA